MIMNKKIIYSSLMFLAAIFSGCSDTDDPVIKLDSRYLENVYGPAPEFDLLSEPTKNVLLEEFTGHKCGFCPPATAMVKLWDAELGDRLVPVTIHAGTLAAVGSEPFERDFTNPDGNTYWAQVEGGFNPSGRVNRVTGVQNAYPDAFWRDMIDEEMAKNPEVAMQMVTSFVQEDGIVNVHAHAQFLSNLSGNYDIVVLLTESKIISAQEDYSQEPSEIIDYEHNHVLHDAITPAAGLPLASNPRGNDTFVKSFSYELNTNWNPEHCHIVAFVINRTTGEVLNVVEKDVVQ